MVEVKGPGMISSGRLLCESHQARVLSRCVSSSTALLKAPGHDRLRVYLPNQDEPHQSQAVCLLVGWSNSSNKVIGKYASIYTELGVPCIALAPRMSDIWFTSHGNKLCEDALKVLEEKVRKNEGLPLSLVIHLFSGGIYVVFPKILESWSRSDFILRTGAVPKCVVFDSGPSDYTFQSGTAASKLLLQQGALNRISYYIANAIGISTAFLIGSHKRAVLRSALESEAMALPQLYLHSQRDTVAPLEWVSAVMKEQQAKGRAVSSHIWDDSQHLRLYLDHKEEYTNQVHTFLKAHQIV